MSNEIGYFMALTNEKQRQAEHFNESVRVQSNATKATLLLMPNARKFKKKLREKLPIGNGELEWC